MIVQAYKTNDDATIKAVKEIAKKTYPDDEIEIDRIASGDAALLAARRAADRRAEEARIRAAGFLDIWKGEVELGGSRATGNSDIVAVYAAANLTRDGIEWRHKLNARVDFQRTDDETTAERVLVAYQPNYKFSLKSYAAGIAQYEHDRFLGYTERYTLGVGIGHDIIDRPDLKVSVEGGPALRRTVYTDEAPVTAIAPRASMSARWSLSPDVVLKQDASGYLERDTINFTSITSLETRLIGALKAKLSYNVLYERNAPEARRSLDTLTRATFVYGF
ncbi:DUF481 domain-containing protein [Sphingomonas naphthae]|uniref:DUF481 domain-containing protein n=1 Tax=Sphingomonas naphthae TaxID=1813468 RepID=A0ABY7TPW1_9SPHN|nr:DUF481 domain-containing protein [Sphingomonas naphthae]WCT74726.1 DUF481 domain-containing protein [Sphingomonas naphthae]